MPTETSTAEGLVDTRVSRSVELDSPNKIIGELPLSDEAVQTVRSARDAASNIIQRKDDRLLVITGPCSIHDPKAAKEFAGRLLELRKEHKQDLEIVMRAYFEKPRTIDGWRGLIMDPDRDNTFDVNKGLRMARSTLLHMNGIGVPTGTEFLEVMTPQYIDALIAWGAIGARTTESQIHRQLTSGLSMPIGYKNGTGGGTGLALDAIQAATKSTPFLSIDKDGKPAIIVTSGNPDSHIILRGGSSGPNYHVEDVEKVILDLDKRGIPTGVMVDNSHGNSLKRHQNQPRVNSAVSRLVADGNSKIMGVMIEAFLTEGRQDDKGDAQNIYGQSITDECVGWETQVDMISELAKAVQSRRKKK